MPDPGDQMRQLLGRLAIPVVAAWVLFGLIAALVYSRTWKIVLLSVPAIVTLLAIGLVVFALRQAKKARGVAGILSNVETDADRKAAIEKLEISSQKNDPAAIFAKAQLELQEDPKTALKTLERIDLGKVMGPIADEARGQRAMIHLMQGDVSEAKTLVSGIDLKRHQEPRTRAMLAAVSAEAWARSGDAKKAVETLGVFDIEDSAFEQLRPQLYRAWAFAYAYTNDLTGMRRMLKKLAAQDVRLLGGFLMKRTHPLLQKEAKRALEQSGQMPRKMVVQRR
ncbi:MAG TPA: hypothetical protein VMS65_08825 [Polyangiaceae bacterium]|nr:hypothetical protein [Polyangiaceae bacterium]